MTNLELLCEMKKYRDELELMGISEYGINGMNALIKYAESIINIDIDNMFRILEANNDKEIIK